LALRVRQRQKDRGGLTPATVRALQRGRLAAFFVEAINPADALPIDARMMLIQRQDST
jgi:hypothetical protein